MSLAAISAASKVTGIPSPVKFVLMALADFANDEQEAWPKQSTIATWTCLSRETVNRILDRLENEYGLITSTQQYKDDGGYRNKRYRINLDIALTQPWNSPTAVTENHKRCDGESQGGVTGAHNRTTTKEPPIELNPSSSGDDGGLSASLFGEEVNEGVGSPASSSPTASTSQGASASPKRKASPRKTLTLTDSRFLELLPRVARAWNDNCGKLPKLRNDVVPNSYKANTLRMVNEAILDDIDPVEAIAVAAGVVKGIDWYLERGGYGNLVAGRNWRKHYDAGIRNYKPEVVFASGDEVTWLRNPNMPGAGVIAGRVVSVAADGVVTVMPHEQRGVQVIQQTINALRLTLVRHA